MWERLLPSHSTSMEHREHASSERTHAKASGPASGGEAISEQKIQIENWEVIINPWKMKQYFRREVYGHPNFSDGQTVTSSGLVELRDDVAMTKSGTVQLGKRRKQDLNKPIPCLSM